MKTAVIGAGSWGTALAIVLADAGHEVGIWARETDIVSSINKKQVNPTYLKSVALPSQITAYTSLAECCRGAKLVIMATPSHAMRTVATKTADSLDSDAVVVSVAKGIELDGFNRMSNVLKEALDGVIPAGQIGVLSGPTHAEEVALRKPAAIVASSQERQTSVFIQNSLITPMLRVYINSDITGVEIAGSVKNIMAIATGIIDGAELGDNAAAGLITRSLAEIKRFGINLGAKEETFNGLAGIGDLVVTCTSRHSRNRYVGYEIGRGKKLSDVIEKMDMVAEGVKTTKSVREWGQSLGIDMPITESVYQVLFEDVKPQQAVYDLMTREPKEEAC